MKALSLSVFKKKFGLSTSQVRRLAQNGTIQIQQNGYVGDILHHRKIVVFPESFVPLNQKICRELKRQSKEAKRLIRSARESLFTLSKILRGMESLADELQTASEGTSETEVILKKVKRIAREAERRACQQNEQEALVTLDNAIDIILMLLSGRKQKCPICHHEFSLSDAEILEWS